MAKIKVRFKDTSGTGPEVKVLKLTAAEVERYLRLKGTIVALERRLRSYCLSGANVAERLGRFEDAEEKLRTIMGNLNMMCGCIDDRDCADDEICVGGICIPM